MRLLVVGTRFGSTWMEAATSSENWDVAGLVARTESSRKEAGKKFNVDVPNQFSTLEAALDNCRGVDAVVIATPNALHYDMAKLVLDRGFHLILEKPIVETWEQAIDLVSRLDENAGSKACVGQTLRGDVMIRFMEHFLREGIIGRIEQLTFESHWNWVDDPSVERNWRFRLPDMFIDDIGIHQIDEIRMILGNSKCDELVAMTMTPPSYPIPGLNATASGIWTMDDGVHVNYFGSMGARGKSEGWYGRVNVFGEKGSIFRGSSGQPYLYLEGEREPIGLDDKYGDDIDELLPLIEFEKIPYILEDFYHAIKDDRAPVTDLHDNINSHAILMAMKQSAREKRVVNVKDEYYGEMHR
ncbi:MAG: Gfo/Idh/MocA family protein [Promethearchaeota archaeon]